MLTIGTRIMKKKVLALAVALMSVCAACFVSVDTASATRSHVEMTGAGDGHCTKCGLSNGRYRCPAFCPASGAQPTTCSCGHSKASHTYK